MAFGDAQITEDVGIRLIGLKRVIKTFEQKIREFKSCILIITAQIGLLYKNVSVLQEVENMLSTASSLIANQRHICIMASTSVALTIAVEAELWPWTAVSC
jgi:prophage DNA circulation protein